MLGLRFFTKIDGRIYSINGNHGEWKIGKWYTWYGRVKLCESGFHFCMNMYDALQSKQGEWLALVEVGETLASDSKKMATNKMRILQIYPIVYLAIIADLAATLTPAYAAYADAAAYAAYAAADAADAAVNAADAADAADAAVNAAYAAAYAADAAVNATANTWKEKFNELCWKEILCI